MAKSNSHSSATSRARVNPPRLYDGDADALLSPEYYPDRLTMLPGEHGEATGAFAPQRIRVMWGQDLLRDLLDGRYRTVVCGVNDADNSHGIISQLCNLVNTSQWNSTAITSYSRMFHQSVGIHAAHDREPYVLKFDLDRVLVLALLRPAGKDHFTLNDLTRGFATVSKMLEGRRERSPIATVSFLNAQANRLAGPDGREPSFESVLRVMFHSGFRGDVYPSLDMWKQGSGTGVFPCYPFPQGLESMRAGSS